MAVITTNPHRQAVEGPLGSWAAGLIASIRGWIAYRSTVRALSALSDRELSDIGLDRSEIRYYARKAR